MILTKLLLKKCQSGLFPPSCFILINSESPTPIKSSFLWVMSVSLRREEFAVRPDHGQAEQHFMSPCLRDRFCFGVGLESLLEP